ncbi:MAG: cyclopropane fatty acyl phospholipid synthase [Gammaproteobacteria bacterium]
MNETTQSKQDTAQQRDDFWVRCIAARLRQAGLTLNGQAPADMQIHDPRFYRRAVLQGSLGIGEAYVEGWWDCERLDELFDHLLRARLDRGQLSVAHLLNGLRNRIQNLQAVSRAFQVGEQHYDIGNDLFRAMLDQRMAYTCGYWAHAHSLDEAQEHKLELICRKLDLQPGQRILDIGCGWGSFARYAAEKYQVHVVGLTISKEQAEYARNQCRNLPVEIRLQDYREISERFDHIVSVGMFEHVGHKNYRRYMEVAARCLKDGGLFLLHTIGKHSNTLVTDPWISRYIFPNGEIPSLEQVGRAINNIFVLEDLHNFGADYDRTLMAWYRNFHAAWPSLRANYNERFYRIWKYYLNSCAGAFRARSLQLWQLVLSKPGCIKGYRRPAF